MATIVLTRDYKLRRIIFVIITRGTMGHMYFQRVLDGCKL